MMSQHIAIQSSNAKQYCADKNMPYRTYKLRLAEYYESEDKESWSPNSKRRYNHRVFTDRKHVTIVKCLIVY